MMVLLIDNHGGRVLQYETGFKSNVIMERVLVHVNGILTIHKRPCQDFVYPFSLLSLSFLHPCHADICLPTSYIYYVLFTCFLTIITGY